MKLLVIGVATLLPQLAMADFCTILTRNNPAYADECRKQGAAGGAEFHGNWSILGVDGFDPKTKQKGKWRTAMTPPAGGKWTVLGRLDRDFYLGASCFLGKRTFDISEGADAADLTSDKPNVWLQLDNEPVIQEAWRRDDKNLLAPPDSKIGPALAKASKLTVTMPRYRVNGELVGKNVFVYELNGYAQASKALCK